jgi:hypothetical protein
MMNGLCRYWFFCMINCLLIVSCEPKIDPGGYLLKFSDGSIYKEKDIEFYDSSTHILFLKDKLKIDYMSGTSPNIEYAKFTINVDNDVIFQGLIYPSLNTRVPDGYHIPSNTLSTFESDILKFHYSGINTQDARNDHRIINAFEKSHLLNAGISCTIDSICVCSYIDSTVKCTFTIRNNDDINYYIPDPGKMEVQKFNTFFGDLVITNKETHKYHSPTTDKISPDWDYTMKDLSLLEEKCRITFTYTLSLIPKIDKGSYEARLRFYTFSTLIRFDYLTMSLSQENGRVWIGETQTIVDNVIFN